jgi:hypothetical protein
MTSTYDHLYVPLSTLKDDSGSGLTLNGTSDLPPAHACSLTFSGPSLRSTLKNRAHALCLPLLTLPWYLSPVYGAWCGGCHDPVTPDNTDTFRWLTSSRVWIGSRQLHFLVGTAFTAVWSIMPYDCHEQLILMLHAFGKQTP